MKFAVNYSLATADLLQRNQIQLDYLKCPAWPDVTAAAQQIAPAYVHFPLKVGLGIRDAIDTETGRPADWNRVERLLTETGTRQVNLHLAPTVNDYPDFSCGMMDPHEIEMVTERMIQDVAAVTERFGPERVIVETVAGARGGFLPPGYLLETVGQVITETNCGLLLDISHARLAARFQGVDAREYIQGLPVEQIHEIHITGIQRFEGEWIRLVRRARIEEHLIELYAGQLVDHLPMTDVDWTFFSWAVEKAQSGAWGNPRMVTFEYGGVGSLFEAVTKRCALAKQITRLLAMVKGEEKA